MDIHDKAMENLMPIDTSSFWSPNAFKTIIECFILAKKLKLEREEINHKKINDFLSYINDYCNSEELENDISTQVNISIYFEKLKKVTLIAIEYFDKKKEAEHIDKEEETECTDKRSGTEHFDKDKETN